LIYIGSIAYNEAAGLSSGLLITKAGALVDYHTVTIVVGSTQKRIRVEPSTSLMNALIDEGFYLPSPCGGKGTCGKCKVKVLEGTLVASDADLRCLTEDKINTGIRLACKAYPKEDLTISIPMDDEDDFETLTYFASDPPSASASSDSPDSPDSQTAKDTQATPTSPKHSIAIDIGTTTIACALVDKTTGVLIDTITAVNKQRKYGADVISRIEQANNGKLTELTSIIRRQIIECVQTLCEKNNVAIESVSDTVIAANMTMIHILLGLNCKTLGVYPFTPVTLEHIIKNANEIFEENYHGTVHILPGISTYVGADITSGLYFSDFIQSNEPAVFLDIGTNGELVVKKDDTIYCAATAAGPAFEGGNISNGTGSVTGAIRAVKYTNGKFEIETIGDSAPIGICGSGVIDIVAECLKSDLLDDTGRIAEKYVETGIEIAKQNESRITFTQKDVRELQLGKSAIRSGLDTLLAFTGLKYEDIGKFFIAGGFGFHLNIENAVYIGLIPAELAVKISVIGNSSLGGAVKYLNEGQDTSEISRIIKMSTEHSLPKDKMFSELYMENMTLG